MTDTAAVAAAAAAHEAAMIAEIEETGECSIPPFSYLDAETRDVIMRGLSDGGS
jgi:hypothetical protein